MEIWNALSKTDPAQTKRFTRAGGFKGTSVKPIYMDEKMTKQFGPCGIGWGITEPQYQFANGPDGEVIVYCWLSLWFKNGEETSQPVPGVGGDFVVKKTQKGLIPDDEAFKKATTDAISNAMKHIGMAADVHMGQHDDDKYVAELQNELHGNGKAGGTKPVSGPYGTVELQNKLKALAGEIQNWETVYDHDVFMGRQDVIEALQQARIDLPKWMDRTDPNGSKAGLDNLIQQRLDEVRQYDPTQKAAS